MLVLHWLQVARNAAAQMVGVVLGGRHFLRYLNEKRKSELSERKLETWEGEGGAVPVEDSRTAQQVSPRRRQKLSPRGVSQEER